MVRGSWRRGLADHRVGRKNRTMRNLLVWLCSTALAACSPVASAPPVDRDAGDRGAGATTGAGGAGPDAGSGGEGREAPRAAARTQIGIAVFTDARTLFDRAISMWRKRVPAYIYLTTDGPYPVPPPVGGRDTTSVRPAGSNYFISWETLTHADVGWIGVK
jgi:hypothetical protein